jgi:hypothetical protein
MVWAWADTANNASTAVAMMSFSAFMAFLL